MIQHIVWEAGDIDIRKTVIIIIADANTHAVDSAVRHAGLLGNVRKRPIGILAVERIVTRGTFDRESVASALHQEKVQSAITVVIQKSTTSSHRLDEILLVGCPIHVTPSYAQLLSDIRELHFFYIILN